MTRRAEASLRESYTEPHPTDSAEHPWISMNVHKLLYCGYSFSYINFDGIIFKFHFEWLSTSELD